MLESALSSQLKRRERSLHFKNCSAGHAECDPTVSERPIKKEIASYETDLQSYMVVFKSFLKNPRTRSTKGTTKLLLHYFLLTRETKFHADKLLVIKLVSSLCFLIFRYDVNVKVSSPNSEALQIRNVTASFAHRIIRFISVTDFQGGHFGVLQKDTMVDPYSVNHAQLRPSYQGEIQSTLIITKSFLQEKLCRCKNTKNGNVTIQ